jgi:hypothetical protein
MKVRGQGPCVRAAAPPRRGPPSWTGSDAAGRRPRGPTRGCREPPGRPRRRAAQHPVPTNCVHGHDPVRARIGSGPRLRVRLRATTARAGSWRTAPPLFPAWPCDVQTASLGTSTASLSANVSGGVMPCQQRPVSATPHSPISSMDDRHSQPARISFLRGPSVRRQGGRTAYALSIGCAVSAGSKGTHSRKCRWRNQIFLITLGGDYTAMDCFCTEGPSLPA